MARMLLALLALSTALPAPATAAPPSIESRAAEAAKVRARTLQVADWQIAHAEDTAGFTYPEQTGDKRGWVQASFWIAVERLAEDSGEPRFAAAVDRIGAYNHWMPGDRPFHADDQAIVQAYAAAFRRVPDPVRIAPSLAQLRAVMKAAPSGSLVFDTSKQQPDDGGVACQWRWCWSDALFMAPASWIALGAVAGDARLTAYADKEFWATHAVLYSPEDGLFYRDTRFIGQKGAFGERLFWGRGNGWVFAGLANILRELPADHPSRPRYVALFQAMAKSLAGRQRADGFWATSLAAPPERATPEASGSGFFVYGLAYGINHGLLDPARYRPIVEKGWRALDGATSLEGRVGRVQQIGDGPDKVGVTDTQFYGSAAVILAGIEYRKTLLGLRPAATKEPS